MTTLYLHIGTPKTGSSALQTFLRTRRGDIVGAGVFLLPREVDDSIDGLPQPNRRFTKAFQPGQPDRVFLNRVAWHIRNSGCGATVISNEWSFYNSSCADMLLNWCAENGFRLKIICFVRPQYEFANSLFQQFIRNGHGLTAFPFFRNFKFMAQVQYGTYFDKWSRDGLPLLVLPYNTEVRRRGVIDVFFSQIDEVDARRLSLPETASVRRNEALSHNELVFFQFVSAILSNSGWLPDNVSAYFTKHSKALRQVRLSGETFNYLSARLVDEYEHHFSKTNRLFCEKYMQGRRWEDVYADSIRSARLKAPSQIGADDIKAAFDLAFQFVQTHGDDNA